MELKPTVLVTSELAEAFLKLSEQVKVSPAQPAARETIETLVRLREEAIQALRSLYQPQEDDA